MISIEIKSDILSNVAACNLLPGKRSLSDNDIVHLCESHRSFPPSVIGYRTESESAWLFATDRIRSIPVFYTLFSGRLLISDTIQTLLPYIPNQIEANAAIEFMVAGYVTGNVTLLKDVKQLRAGEYLWADEDGIRTGFYHRYLSNSFYDEGIDVLKNNLINIFEQVFISLVEQLHGRTAAIPLSGGYDSRLITYWLHRLKYKNIVCYTFGRPGNIEVENARITAEKLNLRWLFIDYTQLGIKDYLNDEGFAEYYQFMANHSAMFFMQDYFAIKYLKEEGLIPIDSVFIPGHSGDFLGGSHLRPSLKYKLSLQQIAVEIYKKHYELVEVNRHERKEFIAKIRQNIVTGYPAHLVFEDWDLREFQAKFNVNSARIYPFFGYSYYLPLWDVRIIEFFKNLPFELKLYKRLYNEVLIELFEPAGINFEHETQSSKFVYRKQRIKQIVMWYLPVLKKLKRLPENDSICYREITSCMSRDLNEKGIAMRRLYSYNGNIVQWYLNQLKNSK